MKRITWPLMVGLLAASMATSSASARPFFLEKKRAEPLGLLGSAKVLLAEAKEKVAEVEEETMRPIGIEILMKLRRGDEKPTENERPTPQEPRSSTPTPLRGDDKDTSTPES